MNLKNKIKIKIKIISYESDYTKCIQCKYNS